jgi:branched-chain amino acid transport system permease protein
LIVEQFFNQFMAGVASGAIYASLALSLVMIFKATRHINFAQGEMATFSTYLAWALIGAGWSYWLTFFFVVALSFVIGALTELMLLRKLEKADALSFVGVFIGLMLSFNSVPGWLWNHEIKAFPSPFEGFTLGGALSPHQTGTLAVVGLMLALITGFFRFTRLGLAMRAAALNPASSRFVGIHTGRMLALGWGLAAAIGAVAGMLIAPVVFLEPHMMSGVMVYAFASALLGGIDSPFGAVVGGFAIGIIENIAGAYVVGTEMKLTLALVLIVTVLLVRPSGIFGSKIVKRV